MKKNIIKYLLYISAFSILAIIYLSIVGLETKKFNNQIKDRVNQINNNLEIDIKKIKLTLDPFNFKINAKTIGTNILYKKKNLELEYIKTEIALISLIKNKIVSSNLKFSTKSILLKDLITFVRAITNKPELFIIEKAIKKGQVIANIEVDFDENGIIKKNYKISGTLKDGKIELFKNYNFEKIDFILDFENNILNFKDISFNAHKINFFSDNLKITKSEKSLFIEGEVENTVSKLNNKLLKLINFNIENFNFINTNFSSKSNFSFSINKKFKIEDLIIDSMFYIDNSTYKKDDLFDEYLLKEDNLIHIKEHVIKTSYKKNDLILEGSGKIKFEKKFDDIKYKVVKKEKYFKLFSNILISNLRLKNKKFLKTFFPKSNEILEIKNQRIEINYSKDSLSIKGLGEIKLEKEFNKINYNILKKNNKTNFGSKISLNKTSFDIDFLNFKSNDKLETQLQIAGNYNDKKELNFKEISVIEKNNQILLENFLLDKNNLFIKVDKIKLNYFDTEGKKNQLLFLRKQKNDYNVNGSSLNANNLIDNLLNGKNNSDSKIFKNNISLILDLGKVYIDEKNFVNNLKGKLDIKDNKVFKADIFAFFSKNEKLTFTINTNNTGEKITTFFSSRAKPIVKRYKFIKGYEEGYLDFSSSKKNNISKSKLNIYNFKLQELPTLTKLLTLASLKGIADTLSGEGIRFNEFEMNFTNKDDLMTIEEIYAIGPAISILMSGYIEEDKLVSLRGTLVPATTINKKIGSIPFFGKILVGDKTGEGVFGVSFKIKGPPKNLETTVNPIKTLTPRFITRTLEKIKKN